MNRTTVLILALVLLLAHVLAMHHDGTGAFAMPSDVAHVDFRIARNAVHGLGSSWTTGSTPAAIAEEGSTSLLWTLVAVIAEFFATSPVRVSAVVGILAALLTLAFVSRLAYERLVGVTATVLLVVSGPFAASAADGTETSLYTMLIALAFLSLERRRSRLLGLSLALAILTRSDGIPMALGFLVIALLGQRSEARRLSLARAFVPPLLATAVLLGIRIFHGAPALPPALALALSFDGQQIRVGLWSVEALVRGSLAPLLVLLPTIQFLLGRLSGTGRRALGLAALSTAIIVLQGASSAAMHVAFVPALPLAFIAVQQGFIGGLDRHPSREWMAWTALSAACLASVMASKIPGNLGPLPTRSVLEAMAAENAVRQEAYGDAWNGRIGLSRELRSAARLRALGLFFRDHTAPEATILTPWPGAIAYLTGSRVVDLLQRAGSPDGSPTAAWVGRTRADVLAALERAPDYIVPQITDHKRPPSLDDLVMTWLERYDSEGVSPARKAAVAAALEPYELVAVPTPAHEEDLNAPSKVPAFLLRRRSLGLDPHLFVTRIDQHLELRVGHRGHHQIAELEVRATTPTGETLYLAPTGEFKPGPPLRARAELLLFPTGSRRILLIRAPLPGDLAEARITARLLNPFSDPDDPLAWIGSAVTSEP